MGELRCHWERAARSNTGRDVSSHISFVFLSAILHVLNFAVELLVEEKFSIICLFDLSFFNTSLFLPKDRPILHIFVEESRPLFRLGICCMEEQMHKLRTRCQKQKVQKHQILEKTTTNKKAKKKAFAAQ